MTAILIKSLAKTSFTLEKSSSCAGKLQSIGPGPEYENSEASSIGKTHLAPASRRTDDKTFHALGDPPE